MSNDFLLKLMLFASAFGSIAVAGSLVLKTILAVRAKIRAQILLQSAARGNEELRRLIKHAEKHRISVPELERAVKLIDIESRHLSAQDQRFIRAGIHQTSMSAVKRFVSDVLARA